jgi:3-oxoacyl-[acyl-carrier-protein] synthase I
MKRSVHIAAIAARTPIGVTAEGSAAALRARITRIQEHPFMVERGGGKLYCGRDGRLPPTLLGAPRVAALVQAALAEISAKLTAHEPFPDELALLLALPEERPGFTRDDVRHVSRALAAAPSAALPGLRLERVGQGHAGALEALQRGAARVALGQAEVVLIGGVDSYLEADTLDWLDEQRRLARGGIRAGFPPGEAASIVALASASACRALRLPPLGELLAAECTKETRDPSAGAGLLGEALTQAIVQAAGDRFESRAYVSDVYCDINGERPRTTDWGFALLRVGAFLRDGTQYVTPVSACGDLGAASAAFNVALSVRAWQRGYASGPRSLIWGASWHGLRAAALIDHGGAAQSWRP